MHLSKPVQICYFFILILLTGLQEGIVIIFQKVKRRQISYLLKPGNSSDLILGRTDHLLANLA